MQRSISPIITLLLLLPLSYIMFTCISCRVAFEDASEQRAHFSTDWHRYNMKRRVANLPPVAATAFNEKVVERREQNAVRTDPRDLVCDACR
jgi:pre-60S factor REI1